jgi:hypothetical protein
MGAVILILEKGISRQVDMRVQELEATTDRRLVSGTALLRKVLDHKVEALHSGIAWFLVDPEIKQNIINSQWNALSIELRNTCHRGNIDFAVIVDNKGQVLCSWPKEEMNESVRSHLDEVQKQDKFQWARENNDYSDVPQNASFANWPRETWSNEPDREDDDCLVALVTGAIANQLYDRALGYIIVGTNEGDSRDLLQEFHESTNLYSMITVNQSTESWAGSVVQQMTLPRH